MKKFAVLLAGCGSLDGAEIHESVLTLLAIDKLGASYRIFAPDINQYHVINHYKKRPMDETRNILVEAARIARGDIQPLSQYRPEDYDALVMPGGFGVAKNLCTYAFDGANMQVNAEVEAALQATKKLGKPIGALCIAPVILAKVFGNVTLTIGKDETTEKNIQSLGAKNIRTGHGDVVVDEKNNLFSTPCYMLDAHISNIAEGAENLIKAMLKKM
ncbi:MAG TPA: isoprenoid biosynthesis glyoxalase ElbB [Bacteroidales bacterium]|nr:isoprenoid biosynthesis glyoxalase ElbB [Bacteroidales bacterium]HPB25023.1 isoprenoid biosynthesis glyoxalase ElbB [Bacteroidales bacterium]HPI30159.1 isoprenoid biosynthesis glyoxalase ElbB [Bacteroidales bacterium]HQN15172.1 isoprenoid biosynthesis glyoxalase ElbB [Bacteroidales bacterium]HQP15412.1 isoprenoid biosynthesis glyoxalase ElbB [Bacteroidales bacterium]